MVGERTPPSTYRCLPIRTGRARNGMAHEAATACDGVTAHDDLCVACVPTEIEVEREQRSCMKRQPADASPAEHQPYPLRG